VVRLGSESTPLHSWFSTDSGWYAEADFGVGPWAVGANIQGPGGEFSEAMGAPSGGSFTIFPKVGQGAGLWISPAGEYYSMTFATPTLGDAVDWVKSKGLEYAKGLSSLFSPPPPATAPNTARQDN